jgi:hypothetical protein
VKGGVIPAIKVGLYLLTTLNSTERGCFAPVKRMRNFDGKAAK